MTLQERVREVADQVAQGRTPTVTVRDLLSWYGASRRGYWINLGIRKALTEAGLKTDPDFESAYIDAEVKLVPADAPAADVTAAAPAPEAAAPGAPVQEPIVGALRPCTPTPRTASVSWRQPISDRSRLHQMRRSLEPLR